MSAANKDENALFPSPIQTTGSNTINEYDGFWSFHGWNWGDVTIGTQNLPQSSKTEVHNISVSTTTTNASLTSILSKSDIANSDAHGKVTSATTTIKRQSTETVNVALPTPPDLSHLVSTAAAYKFLPIQTAAQAAESKPVFSGQVKTKTSSSFPSVSDRAGTTSTIDTTSTSVTQTVSTSAPASNTVNVTVASSTTGAPSKSHRQLHTPLQHLHHHLDHLHDATTFTALLSSSSTSSAKASVSSAKEILPAEVKSAYFAGPIDEDLIPRPSQLDFFYMDLKCHELAVTAALGVVTESDANSFLRNIGMRPLFEVLTQPNYRQIDVKDISVDSIPFGDTRVEAVKGICRVIRAKKDVADLVGTTPEVIEVLTDLIEAPMKRFSWASMVDRDKQLRAQREATALVQRLVRSSDEAVRCLRQNERWMPQTVLPVSAADVA